MKFQSSLLKAVLMWKPLGKIPLGRPKQRWIDNVKKTGRIWNTRYGSSSSG